MARLNSSARLQRSHQVHDCVMALDKHVLFMSLINKPLYILYFQDQKTYLFLCKKYLSIEAKTPTNVDYVSVNLDYFVNNFLYQSTFQTNLRHLVPYDLGSIWSGYY